MLWARIRSVAIGVMRRRNVEAGMSEEIRFHIAARAQDLIGRGMDAEKARRQARLEFGSIENIRKKSVRLTGCGCWTN